MNIIKQAIGSPLISFGLIAIMSITALAAAFIGEHVFGLEPCNLCIYQRYPFAIGIILGLLGIALHKRKKASISILIIIGINFLINSAIAFYHTGVEQAWWKSAFEGCAVPMLVESNNKTLLENIMGSPLTSCTDIQWVDPVFGFSMANYNVVFCFGLFIFCVICAVAIKKTP